MKARALAVAFVFAVAAFSFTAVRSGAADPAPLLDLGYGPSTLFPASAGTPVFTAGDELWIRSHYGSTIQIKVESFSHVPGFNSTQLAASISPAVPVRVLTFNSTDQGLWSIDSVNQLFPLMLFVVSDAQAVPANLTLSSYEVTGGSLRLNLATSPALQMYSAQACVLGGSDDSTARVDIPSGIGAGHLNISMGVQSLEVLSVAPPRENYTLSVELYRSFSFLLPNSTTVLASRLVRVATTGSVLMTGYSEVPALFPLQSDIQLVPGTYQIRAFFVGAGGVFLGTADAIFTGKLGWLWLGGCRTYPVYANSFTLKLPLGSGPSGWPRSVWLTYSAYGEEEVAHLSLGIRLSTVNFVGVPWGVKLKEYAIDLDSTTGITETSVGNGTITAVLDSASAQLQCRLRLGSHVVFDGAVGPVAPYTSTNVTVDVSRLDVKYLVGGVGYGGASVRVSDSSGVMAVAATDASGQATFYLPTGRYNVTATGGNSSAAGSVYAVAGQSKQLVLGATAAVGLDSLALAALSVASVAGALANAALWVRSRRSSRPAPGAQRTSPSQK